MSQCIFLCLSRSRTGPVPSNFAPANSPSNFDNSHNPPDIIALTSVPLETAGSVSGPAWNDLTVASHVPSSSARILCSAVGCCGPWAIAVVIGNRCNDAEADQDFRQFHRGSPSSGTETE